jgi:hypothetical protein
MKKALIIILTVGFILNTKAQTSTWGNPDYISFYSKFLNRIDTVNLAKGDIQLRLWFNNGGNRINTATYIALTKHGNKWDASYYTFISYPRRNDSIIVNKKEPVRLNYDSLYKQLLQDSLLTLNSDTINQLMDKKGQYSYMWTDSGPTNYTIQILTNSKRQTVNFKCPKYFFYEAKIAEFEIPLKVISSLLKLIGLTEPC